jgi:EAL domain-containing protein (putative c-di-GMP-specific phosphodiesterase class I)/CHASE2 domain-containing sensor protein
LLALLVAVSASLLFAGGLFDPIEDGLTAKRAEMLSRQPTGQTAIIEIDARSLAELRSWPWPRSYHAKVVRQLHQSGASIIAFDVDFSARSESGDQELASAIREAGHVVLPIFQQKASATGDDRVLSSRPDATFESAWVGGVNIFPDHDGIVREYPAATMIEGAIQPSIATLVAEQDSVGDRSFEPDWAVEITRIPRFSFVDVMKGRVSAAELRGKRLLIGATAIELGDRYAVPRYGVVPGVVIQAIAAESLLQHRAMQRTGSIITILGVLLIAFLLAPRPLRRPAQYALQCVAVFLVIAGVPVLAQKLWPISVDSAVWYFTLIAAVAVQAIVEARRRLRIRAQFDAESGLPNRTVLEAVLASSSAAQVLAVAAIERFETIRDTIGLAATNDMIRNSAELIGRITATTVYRIGPDLVAWLDPCGKEAPVQSTLDEILAAFRAPVLTRVGPVDVNFTMGFERDEGGTVAVLRIEHALMAISNARSTGRAHDWYRGYHPQSRGQLSMMSDLRQAMEKGRLRLAYQPKLSLTSGCITDAEALIRWHDADGHTVSPDEFIPLAEATGVIHELTIFALRAALADMTQWVTKGVAVRVAVNVSALDLTMPKFADTVARLLADSAVPASQLALEVTESSLIRSSAEAIATLEALRDQGIRLSVDDYGTGQSTLSYLKHLPVHELKIDKSFVTSLASIESDAIMVRSTIELAHDLGLQVVAEGIEDNATLDVLRQMGCDYAQGYFISKPVEADEFFALAAKPSEIRRVA